MKAYSRALNHLSACAGCFAVRRQPDIDPPSKAQEHATEASQQLAAAGSASGTRLHSRPQPPQSQHVCRLPQQEQGLLHGLLGVPCACLAWALVHTSWLSHSAAESTAAAAAMSWGSMALAVEASFCLCLWLGAVVWARARCLPCSQGPIRQGWPLLRAAAPASSRVAAVGCLAGSATVLLLLLWLGSTGAGGIRTGLGNSSSSSSSSSCGGPASSSAGDQQPEGPELASLLTPSGAPARVAHCVLWAPPEPLAPVVLRTLHALGGGLAPLGTHALLSGLPNTFTMVRKGCVKLHSDGMGMGEWRPCVVQGAAQSTCHALAGFAA